MATGSSSPSAEPPNNRPFPNPPPKDLRPLNSISSPPVATASAPAPAPAPAAAPPTSSPPTVHPAQTLPLGAGKISNPNPPQMPGVHDPSAVPPQGFLYPVASSGRGFGPRGFRPQSAEQSVTVANPAGLHPRSVLAFPNQVRPFGFYSSDPQAQTVHSMRPPPPNMQHMHLGSRQVSGTVSGQMMSIPVASHPKVSPFPSSASDFNGYKDLRDRSRDDTILTIRDRKVRVSDGASLYALCRSWLRNGSPLESQPQFGEGERPLPRPLPTTVGEASLSRIDEADEEEEKEEDASSVENLSARDLLQRHIKRAKKVRARLREERLHRIARYKQRLALLLPQQVEQCRNDMSSGS